ncbi:unnamed protein product, partial [Meganyctiphanes norvegica]
MSPVDIEKVYHEENDDIDDIKKRKGCCRCHLNSLGSLGYCVVAVGLSTYVIATEVQQFIKYLKVPWPHHTKPLLELNIHIDNLNLKVEMFVILNYHIGLVCAAAVLLIFFFFASIFKIGNYANDGYKLGVQDATCSKDPPPLPGPAGGLVRGAWLHGGPTAAFLHLLVAHLLILARLIMEAQATKAGFLDQKNVWWSELSSVLPQMHRDSIFNALQAFEEKQEDPVVEAEAGPVALRYEASTSITFTSGGSSSVTGLEEEDNWHLGEIAWGPFTPHFLNYILAHLVYAGKYASVFWGTNKGLGLVFFLQLLFNVAQSALALSGFQVLYKVQVAGPEKVLPQYDGFLLPLPILVAVFNAFEAMVLASGSVIYLYGYYKFNGFLNAEKEKYHILNKAGHQPSPWGYWPHCWSLLLLVLMTATASPIIHDWTVVFRVTTDTSIFVATMATLAHLFLWILLWMVLTIKTNWYFKLRVQISKTIVTNTHSIRLVNEVQLSRQVEEADGPVMVIGAGKTYLMQEGSPKKSLMKIVHNTVSEKKARGEEEEIYWLRPKPPGSGWNKGKPSPGAKHKVTFNDTPTTSRKRNSRDNCPDVLGGDSGSDSSESDGDYARLRDVSFPGPTKSNRCRENTPEEVKEEDENTKLPENTAESESVSVGGDFPAPPPELTNPDNSEPLPPPPYSPPTPPPPLPEQHPPPYESTPQQRHQHIPAIRGASLESSPGRSADSGLVVDLPRSSDASSTSSSVTPPDKRCDSGIHSQASSSASHSKSGSSGSEGMAQVPQPGGSGLPRCSSIDQLCTNQFLPPPPAECPKSMSLTRDMLPPNHKNFFKQQQQRAAQYQHIDESFPPPPPPHQQLHFAPNLHHQQQNLHHQQQRQNQTHNQNTHQHVPAPPPHQQLPNNGNAKGKGPGKTGRLSIEVVGGGYGFLPPSKFVSSEPVYSDASTPVVIKRRSSISQVEPDTPPYERSGSSFSSFTDPQLPRAILHGGQQAKCQTVGAYGVRGRRHIPAADPKHATIGGVVPPKGFHQPTHHDPRYFSVTAVKSTADVPVRL